MTWEMSDPDDQASCRRDAARIVTALWGERVEQVDGYRVGEVVVIRPESPGVRASLGTVRGEIVKLWEDGAAYVEVGGVGILACGTSAFRKVI
jgi:hypothetical protein